MSRLNGIASIDGDLDERKVTVTFEPSVTDVAAIQSALDMIGYDSSVRE